jgi:hypothetical protein
MVFSIINVLFNGPRRYNKNTLVQNPHFLSFDRKPQNHYFQI